MTSQISLIASAALLGAIAAPAVADCGSTTQITDPLKLFQTLGNNTVCVSNGSNGWESQEEHLTVPDASGYQLFDYKRGNTDPIDPRKQVGSWSISTSDAGTAVTYLYTDGGQTSGPYSFTVHNNTDGTISFCSGAKEVVATLRPIGSGCGAAP